MERSRPEMLNDFLALQFFSLAREMENEFTMDK